LDYLVHDLLPRLSGPEEVLIRTSHAVIVPKTDRIDQFIAKPLDVF